MYQLLVHYGEIGDGLPVVDIDLRPGRRLKEKKIS